MYDMYRLAKRGDEFGVQCDEAGLAYGPIPVIARDDRGAFGIVTETALPPAKLAAIVKALNSGELGRAIILATHMRLPPLTSAQIYNAIDELAKYNHCHIGGGCPEGGQFCSGDGDGGFMPVHETILINPPKSNSNNGSKHKLSPATSQEIAAFIHNTLPFAQDAAAKSGIPVENILGLAALESSWGRSKFAVQGNNIFGLHSSSKDPNKFILSDDGQIKMMKFENVADCTSYFISKYGSPLTGITDPEKFAQTLQSDHGFGIEKDGKKQPKYVQSLAITIKNMGAKIDRDKNYNR